MERKIKTSEKLDHFFLLQHERETILRTILFCKRSQNGEKYAIIKADDSSSKLNVRETVQQAGTCQIHTKRP